MVEFNEQIIDKLKGNKQTIDFREESEFKSLYR